MVRTLAVALIVVSSFATATACGSSSDSASSSDAGSPDSGASTSSGGDPCAPLAKGTDLSGCVAMYCECVDGTATRVGGGCSNGVGRADCTFGCAQHGGSGTAKPLENVYSSPECLAYCNKLHGLGCPAGAETSIENSIAKTCSFIRVTPDAGAASDAGPSGPATCAEAAKQNLTCLVGATAKYTCNQSGFSTASPCANSVYEDACTR